MPVGTLGTVKGLHTHEILDEVKAQIILGNTYHLYLRPGLDVLEAAGGLHKFNGFHKPMLTDSGGFQVFSLTGIRKLSENGCEFRSHVDGSKHLFTPESVMDIERTIGALPALRISDTHAKVSISRTAGSIVASNASQKQRTSMVTTRHFSPSFKVVFTQNCAAKVHSLWQNVTQKVMPSGDLL